MAWPEVAVFLGVMVAVIILSRPKPLAQRHVPLRDHQRLRPLAVVFLEPVLELVLVAVVLRDELSQGGAHWWAAALGAVLGLGLGLFRVRNVYVRSEVRYHAVVVRDTRVETFALLGLLALDIASQMADQHLPIVSLFVTAALAVLLANTFTVAAEIARRYRRSARRPEQSIPAEGVSDEGPGQLR